MITVKPVPFKEAALKGLPALAGGFLGSTFGRTVSFPPPPVGVSLLAAVAPYLFVLFLLCVIPRLRRRQPPFPT